MLEIELKVKLESFEQVRQRLSEKSGEFVGRVHEHDVYYNHPHRDFRETDEALRVRYSGGNAVLTYKGKKIKGLGLKAREELITAVKTGEVLEQILSRLGFVRTAEVNKWRETYRIGNASVALDEVEHLGRFIEIEVIADSGQQAALDAIGRIARDLGVTGEPILASYLELLQAKQ
jgi:adenylate cyclase class 2